MLPSCSGDLKDLGCWFFVHVINVVKHLLVQWFEVPRKTAESPLKAGNAPVSRPLRPRKRNATAILTHKNTPSALSTISWTSSGASCGSFSARSLNESLSAHILFYHLSGKSRGTALILRGDQNFDRVLVAKSLCFANATGHGASQILHQHHVRLIKNSLVVAMDLVIRNGIIYVES